MSFCVCPIESDEKSRMLRSDFYSSAVNDSQSGSSMQISSNRVLSVVKPDDNVWLELSLVSAVEKVYVWVEEDLYKVVTVVNDNDPQLREQIYDRELAVIEGLPDYKFDFHVLPRMGHELSELVDYADKPAYRKR